MLRRVLFSFFLFRLFQIELTELEVGVASFSKSRGKNALTKKVMVKSQLTFKVGVRMQ
jgi:hypothetical protein